MPEPEYIDPKHIRPGPIRHDSLPDDLLDPIRSIYEVVGPYLSMTLEQFEIGFMRDLNPENEVVIWSSIAAAWLDYHSKHLGDELLADEEEKKLLAALIVISTGETNAANFGVPPDIGQKLLDCYDVLGDEE